MKRSSLPTRSSFSSTSLYQRWSTTITYKISYAAPRYNYAIFL